MVLAPRAYLRAAAVVAGAFLVLLALAYGSSGARWLDASALQGFIPFQDSRVGSVADRLVELGDPRQVGILGVLIALVALARGRPRSAVFVLALLGATSVSSQVLKSLLAYPRYSEQIQGAQIAPAAFPSGHATASMALAIALVVVMPARLRPAAAVVGAGLALAVSFSVVALGWHFPSDVAGGFLLATGWALVLLAALRWAALRWPERAGRSRAALVARATVDRVAAIGLAALIVTGAVVLTALAVAVVVLRPGDLIAYVQDHTTFFVVAAALAGVALALLASLATVLQRRA